MDKEINWLLKEKYFGKPSEKFIKDVERLKAGEPLAYVIGFVNFLNCKIDLSKKPLIPRTETEFWLEKVISPKSDGRSFSGKKVLDIFSGSGCIGVAVLKNIKGAKIVFAEKDKNLLVQIRLNCKINNISPERYLVKQSDVFSNIKGKFDYIFANPPYIPTIKKSKLQKSVLNYEPHLALFGKKDGLFYIKRFLAKARTVLAEGGEIFMEFDSPQKSAIEKLLKKYGYTSWEFTKDQYGRYRYVVIK